MPLEVVKRHMKRNLAQFTSLKTESVDNAILELSHHGIWAIILCSPNMVTVRVCSKLKTSCKSVVFTNKVGSNSRYFVGVFNKAIIPLKLVGYEMIIANSYPTRARGVIVKYSSLWKSFKNAFTYTVWHTQIQILKTMYPRRLLGFIFIPLS